MHKHLVDYYLKEQRADQREDLQEERGDKHLAKKVTIFMESGQKPVDVEAPRQVRQAGAARHQHQASVP